MGPSYLIYSFQWNIQSSKFYFRIKCYCTYFPTKQNIWKIYSDTRYWGKSLIFRQRVKIRFSIRMIFYYYLIPMPKKEYFKGKSHENLVCFYWYRWIDNNCLHFRRLNYFCFHVEFLNVWCSAVVFCYSVPVSPFTVNESCYGIDGSWRKIHHAKNYFKMVVPQTIVIVFLLCLHWVTRWQLRYGSPNR
jgi:hypothetical protein